jgi:hypothetical protein
MKYHEKSCFVTLTYDEEHLRNCPALNFIAHELREADWIPSDKCPGTLLIPDLQLYFKRLRKAGFTFKYIACGEYGDENFRPHYHCIFFGVGVDDLVSNISNMDNVDSRKDNFWKAGIVNVGTCTRDSIRYTVDYIQKKLNGDLGDKEYAGLQPPFMLVSKGLGKQFILDNDYLKKRDYMTVSGHKVAMPRYYKKVTEQNDNFLDRRERLMRDVERIKRKGRMDNGEQQEKNIIARSNLKKRNLKKVLTPPAVGV